MGTQIIEPLLSVVESNEMVVSVNTQPISPASKPIISNSELRQTTARKIMESQEMPFSPKEFELSKRILF